MSELKIIVITDDPALQDTIGNEVGRNDKVDYVTLKAGKDEADKDIRLSQPDILLVDICMQNDATSVLAWIESLKLAVPAVAVFVCSSDQSPDLIMSAMRAGAQEFLTKPVKPKEFSKAVDKVRHVKSHLGKTPSVNGKVISVFSPKGGLGVTTVAVNLSVAIAQLLDKELAVVDLDFQVGDVSSLLDLSPRYNILDVCDPNGSIDETALQSCMTFHNSGVFVLAEPDYDSNANGVSDAQIKDILQKLRLMYTYVVTDAAHSFDARSMAAFEISDSILVITVASIPSIRATKKALSVLQGRGYGPEKVHVIVNRTHKKDRIDIKEIEEALDFPVLAALPNNFPVVIESVNSGVPLVLQKHLSNVGKSIVRMAEILVNSDGSG